jgi:serine/threonine protein phosphatase PrpC
VGRYNANQTMQIISTHIEQSSSGQDALSILNINETIYFCLADGAGGSSGGKEASKFITLASNLIKLEKLNTPEDFEMHLRQIDSELSDNYLLGESTAIVGKIQYGVVTGASVGDSECWLFNKEFDYQLTNMSINKPLLGSSEAQPIGFGPFDLDGVLLIGTDGLFKYAPHEKIKLKAGSSVSRAKDYSILAQLKSGAYSDDIAVIEVRNAL